MTAALADAVVEAGWRRPSTVTRAPSRSLVERHRAELYVHCLRMLRSPEQAEDALQEALLRAWRSRAELRRTGHVPGLAVPDRHQRLPGRDPPGPGATAAGACRSDSSRSTTRHSCPPAAATSTDPGPDVVLEAKETLEHAFRTAIELLPPRQRAVLLLCEVLRCPATETAALLDTTVAAVNSALQRARATLGGGGQSERAGVRLSDRRPSSAERALLGRYVDSVHRHDVAAVVALARVDAAG